MTYQRLILVGNCGRDPEMRYTPGGDAVTQLNIATNRTYTSNGEKVKETTWFRVSVWGKQAEAVAQYLKKGSMVLIDGELVPDKETGSPRIFERKDGTTGSSYEVRAREVRFLTKASDEEETEDEEISFL